MTETELQNTIHALYEGDTSTPTSSQEDYLVRRIALNTGINRWEQYDSTLWRELYATLTDAADGTKTTTSGTSNYDCPSDFVFPVGYVRVVDGDGGSTYYGQKQPHDAQLFDNSTATPNYYTILGNPKDGHDIDLHPTPTSTGLTIKYEYYKQADAITATTDEVEMGDPYFLVYFVVSRLYELDGRMDLAQKAFTEAEARLMTMSAKNDIKGWWQEDSVPDIALDQGVGGFGV